MKQFSSNYFQYQNADRAQPPYQDSPTTKGGATVISSSFISKREDGLIQYIDDDVLETVNSSNRLSSTYAADETAVDINGTEKLKHKTILHF
jgi:hypothetical protein